MAHRFAALLWLLVLLPVLVASCAQALNYVEPRAPRFVGSHTPQMEPAAPFDGVVDVVTLNIKFARRMDRAQQLFDVTGELGRADVVLLQEMDAKGTDAIAAHLGMTYVYYPAAVHPRTGRDFGNAVLSRWPIARDWKVRLPHRGFFDGSQRTATCATVSTPAGAMDVCSLHLATKIELSERARRDQLRAVVEGLGASGRVIVGGDLNGFELGEEMARDAFDWPTKDVGDTRGVWSIDHIFTRGFSAQGVGKIGETLGATDHAAVWARLVWR